ncbi:DUF1822 family protein [Calothrix sp. FACHB-1219]|uniref:DUF1822 family protein n=1 Tax=unclassified Calothrix TaxID=2619626 RepID=UPI001688F4E8|nr:MULTISPECIES: DUF1822 family protein [unclassified Calothrix]MBD2201398.1 DUF1822 family protein [Calothrix sp. FACHB-168]MBD2215830.1 DUF1822 family protein [Calothrix sp. FACHB-1219]
MTNSAGILTFTVPLSFSAHSLAQEYSKQHHQPEKAKQVYLNILAIYAVEHYFKCMGFESDWENSDSRNLIVQKFLDIADLNIKNLGKFECRPILTDAEVFTIPSEAWENRIGYVAVQLNSSLRQATLLGFLPQLAPEQENVPLKNLHSLEEFPEYLSEKRKQLQQIAEIPKIVYLENWLNNIFDAGWLAVEELIRNQTPSMAFRFRSIASARVDPNDTHSIRRLIAQLYANQPQNISLAELEPSTALSQLIQATQDERIRWKAAELLRQINPQHPDTGARRIIDISMRLGGIPVALMVAVLPTPDARRSILLRVYPMGSQSFVPDGLKLLGLDEAGKIFYPVTAKKEDNYIQFIFSADLGDKFSVNVTLAEASVTEFFVV